MSLAVAFNFIILKITFSAWSEDHYIDGRNFYLGIQQGTISD